MKFVHSRRQNRAIHGADNAGGAQYQLPQTPAFRPTQLIFKIFKTVRAILDSLIFYFLGILFFVTIFSPTLILSLFKKPVFRNQKPRRMLYFVSSDMDALERFKHMSLLKTDLNGYFEKVYTVFFVHQQSSYMERKYGAIHTVFQFSQHPAGFMGRMGFCRLNSLAGEISMFFRLLWLINKEEITIIRAQDPHLLGINAYILSRFTGVPYAIHIITNYDTNKRLVGTLAFPPFKFRVIEYGIEKYILENAYFVTASYEHYKDFALCHGADPERTFSLRTGIDHIHFEDPHKRQNLKTSLGLDGKRLLLYVGRLHPVKFTEDLVRCMGEMSMRSRDAVLLIVGDGPSRKSMETLAGTLGVDEKIIFMGPQSQESLTNLYTTADAIVFTHAGMTLVEAALSEKPIVAYDYDWHAEFLGQNERGFLANFRDVTDLASKICDVLDNPEKAGELGRKAREFAVKNFDSSIIENIERAVYDKFLGAGV